MKLKKHGNTIIVICVILLVLFAVFTFSGIGGDNLYAYPDSIRTTFSSLGYPSQVSNSTSLSGYPAPNQPDQTQPDNEIQISIPTPVPVADPENFPPVEHGHRHFERPARPIMPTATPMFEPVKDSELSMVLAEDLTPQAYLPIIVNPAYRSVKVFAVAYMDDPNYTSQDIENHHYQVIADLTTGSKWHGYTNPNAVPAFVYSAHPDGVMMIYESPPHLATGYFDYDAVYQRFNLCDKIQSGQVDEVWIWESGTGNGAEFVVNGPTWNAIPVQYSVPNCGRTVATFNFNYTRIVDNALHSYNHRTEDALMRFNVSGTSTCDFITKTGPPPSRTEAVAPISDPYCVGALDQNDQLGFVARPMTTNNNIAVCGDIHFPPNVFPPWNDPNRYRYDITTNVSSRCRNWQWDSNVSPSTLNCSAWGCNQRGFMIWWMQNIPGIGNDNEDRNGNLRPVWWDYLWKE